MFEQIYLEAFQIMPVFMQEYSNDLLLSFLALFQTTYRLKLQLHLILLKPRNVLEHLDRLFKVSFSALFIHYLLLCLMNEII
jgi:hypothetical protein